MNEAIFVILSSLPKISDKPFSLDAMTTRFVLSENIVLSWLLMFNTLLHQCYLLDCHILSDEVFALYSVATWMWYYYIIILLSM